MIAAIVCITIINFVGVLLLIAEVQKLKEIQKGIIDVLLANVNKGSKIKIDLKTFKEILNAK